MTRIALIFPQNVPGAPYITNLGLPYLKRYLNQHGFSDVKVIDESLVGREKIEAFLQEYSPDLVGVSCLTFYRQNAIKILRLARKIVPNAVNVLGGVHATLMYEQILTHYSDLIDWIVLGEGEETFLELVTAIQKNRDSKSIRGLAYLNGEKVVKTEKRPYIQNLDQIPFPEQKTFRYFDFPGKETAVMNTSRGCQYNCYFCSTARFWGKWRARSAENVIGEICHLIKEEGARHIAMTDDAFTRDADRVIQICKIICDKKLDKKCSFSCGARIDEVNPKLLKAMKQANFIRISYGIESGSEKMLKMMRKKITPEDILRGLHWTIDAGIEAKPSFMIGNKGETQETIDETCQLIRKSGVKEITVSKYVYIFPGTPLARIAKQEGLLTDDFWLGSEVVLPYTSEHSVQQLTAWQMQTFRAMLSNMTVSERFKFIMLKVKGHPKRDLFNAGWSFIKNLY